MRVITISRAQSSHYISFIQQSILFFEHFAEQETINIAIRIDFSLALPKVNGLLVILKASLNASVKIRLRSQAPLQADRHIITRQAVSHTIVWCSSIALQGVYRY